MRKLAYGLATVLLGATLATGAAADVNIIGEVVKTKTIDVFERIDIEKVVTVTVEKFFAFDSAAEALAIANVSLHDNFIDRNPTFTAQDPHIEVLASITVSIGANDTTGNEGIVGINQDVGTLVNQGNLVAFAFTDDGDSFVNAEASVDQRIVDNEIEWSFVDLGIGLGPTSPNTISVTTTITGSINNNLGITGVNQNGGNINNQTNALAFAASVDIFDDCDCTLAIAEADLGQVNSGNFLHEDNSTKVASLTDSVLGNKGITTLNQTAGNYVNQANVYAVNAAITAQ